MNKLINSEIKKVYNKTPILIYFINNRKYKKSASISKNMLCMRHLLLSKLYIYENNIFWVVCEILISEKTYFSLQNTFDQLNV